MQNPRLFFRVDGKVPDGHSLLGYRVPFKFEYINKLIELFTKDVEFETVQIKVIPSMIKDQTKLLIISTVLKHLQAKPEHSVMLIDDKTRQLVKSTETLEQMFLCLEEEPDLIYKSYE